MSVRHLSTYLEAVALRFFQFARMPCIFGCVDGTLVKILSPSVNEHQYVDRHNEHSINAMFVCGPTMKFYVACVRWPGSVHDARVFRYFIFKYLNLIINYYLLGILFCVDNSQKDGVQFRRVCF